MTTNGSRVIPVAMFATIMTVIPGFLVGALSVQVRGDFGVSRSEYGWGLGSFFLAAAMGSVVLGRSAQRIGPRVQVVAAQLTSAAASLIIAGIARSFLVMALALAVAGLANSANQSAVNLLLSQANLPRLGLAIALKQSGMPGAAMLGGLAVPVIAVTVGWRWAYVLCAAGALVAGLLIFTQVERAPSSELNARRSMRAVTPQRSLILASVGFGCMAYAAGSLNAWLVSSAHDFSGIAEGPAGLLLSLGAGMGVGVRLFFGVRLDRSDRSPLLMAALLSSAGGVGIMLLAFSSPLVTVAGTVLAFGCGWIWPVFTNYGVVRANRESAASASGVTQTGVYLGVFGGPLLSGFVIEWFGFSIMWTVTAAVMLLGAGVTATAASAFDGNTG